MKMGSIDQIIDKHNGEASALIQVMLDIQHENGWLSPEALALVSRRLHVPLARVVHAATFHKAFSLVPPGDRQMHICNGTSCHARGAGSIIDRIDAIGRGEIKTVTCLGCCSSGPVMVVDGKYQAASAAGVEEILDDNQ